MNDRLISLNVAIDAAIEAVDNWEGNTSIGRQKRIEKILKALSSVDAVEVVRCKECKHKPTGTDRDDLEFPDDKCPCKCEDYWYSWKPMDNWFCGNGELKVAKIEERR